MPTGVDVDSMREAREMRLYNRVETRMADLANLPAGRVAWDTSKSDAFEAEDSLNIKARIELMMLRLLPLQRGFARRSAETLSTTII